MDAGEACDDGNILAKDGCSPTCSLETGWACVNTIIVDATPDSVCSTVCGDGIVVDATYGGTEVCDDGTGAAGSNINCKTDCSAADLGWTCSYIDLMSSTCVPKCENDGTLYPINAP